MKKFGILVMLLLVVFILSGCGGGGGGMFGGSSSDNLTSSGTSGNMKFTINWPQTGKSSVLASAYSVKISVCVEALSSGTTTSDGGSVSARATSYDRVVNAIAIKHNTNNSTDSVSINGIPMGSKTVIVQSYNASGSETGYGTQTVTIVKGNNDGVVVTLTEGVFPYTITSALDVPLPTESTTYPNILFISPTGGPVDTTVTISGTGFGDYASTSVVKFTTPNSQNWTSITPITWSNDTITFKIPGSAAPGQILVKVYNGTQSNNVYFNVTSASNGPQITNPMPITVTAGSNFIITGTRFGSSRSGTSNVYFGSLPAAAITTWSDAQIACTAPTSVTNGNLKVVVNGIDSNFVPYTVSGGGWQAVSGFPGGSMQLTGVWMTNNPYRVYVVGSNGNAGAAFLYNNYNWTQVTFPSNPSFNCGYTGVFGVNEGTSNKKVFAIGYNTSGAQIVSGGLDTNTWTNFTPTFPYGGGTWPYPPNFYPRELWVKDPNNLFVVGADNWISPHQGMIGTYANSNWNLYPVKAAQATMINDIWISANNIGFVVGPDGYTRMYNNGVWETYSPIAGGLILNGVWGNIEGTVFYAVGNNGSVYSYYTEMPGWTRMEIPATVAGQTINSVWGSSASNVYAVGTNGTIIHYDGTSWTVMTSGTSNNLISVFGVVNGDIIAVGAAGTVIRCQNGGANVAEGGGNNTIVQGP